MVLLNLFYEKDICKISFTKIHLQKIICKKGICKISFTKKTFIKKHLQNV